MLSLGQFPCLIETDLVFTTGSTAFLNQILLQVTLLQVKFHNFQRPTGLSSKKAFSGCYSRKYCFHIMPPEPSLAYASSTGGEVLVGEVVGFQHRRIRG